MKPLIFSAAEVSSLCKGIHDSLVIWMPCRGFRIPATWFQSLSVELGFWIPILSWIPDSLSCIPERISEFRILQAKFSQGQDSKSGRRRWLIFRFSRVCSKYIVFWDFSPWINYNLWVNYNDEMFNSQNLLGGRVRYIPCGSAPLSAKVTSFIRCVMGCQVSYTWRAHHIFAHVLKHMTS